VFTGFWLEGPDARDHWEDIGLGGRMTLYGRLGDRDRCGERDSAGLG
jgi:hypothetical protein